MSASRNIINEQMIEVVAVVEVVALALRCSTDAKYLLAKRGPGSSGAGYWEFPGGKIELGETQQQALRREIMEELNFDLTSADLSFIGQNMHCYKNHNIIIYLWRAEVNYKPEFRLIDHDKSYWFSVAEIKEINLSEGDKHFILLI